MQKELERQQRLNAARQREIAKAEEHRKEREQARRRIEESLKPAMDKVQQFAEEQDIDFTAAFGLLQSKSKNEYINTISGFTDALKLFCALTNDEASSLCTKMGLAGKGPTKEKFVAFFCKESLQVLVKRVQKVQREPGIRVEDVVDKVCSGQQTHIYEATFKKILSRLKLEIPDQELQVVFEVLQK